MGLCRCNTCNKNIMHMGIARHRSMHRDKYEDCEITYSNGDTYVHGYSELKKREEEADVRIPERP